MSFVTAEYRNASPLIQTSGKGFQGEMSSPVLLGRSTKYRFKDCDGRDWLMYVNPASNIDYDATKMTKRDANTIVFPPNFKGTIQVAKSPPGTDTEALYDKTYGTFVTAAKLYATVNDTRGSYGFIYTKIGSGPLLMFLLPHHVQSLDAEFKPGVTKLQLQTTTKGAATAVWAPADSLSFTESNLPTSMAFAPWTPTMTTARTRFPPDFLLFLASVAELDLRRAMSEPIPQDSYYYAGKSLSKFATLLWVIKEVLNNPEWVERGLEKLKQEMARYVGNVAKFPLYYDDTWKGLVSKAGLEGDPGSDFGNTFYNDHHFHFGYFIHTAAVIGALDPGWLEQGVNKRFINMMVKVDATRTLLDLRHVLMRIDVGYCRKRVRRERLSVPAVLRLVCRPQLGEGTVRERRRQRRGVDERRRVRELCDQDVGQGHRRREHGEERYCHLLAHLAHPATVHATTSY
jgi:endo-1,3(4)-beta-glucanase